MADKKLNAVSTASDGAYVYAEDASGNQIKISKSDLAQVVAGVMGTNLLFPFMYKDSFDNNDNGIDNAGIGIYQVVNSDKVPPYSMMISFVGLTYKVQFFIQMTTLKFAMRTDYTSGWSELVYFN